MTRLNIKRNQIGGAVVPDEGLSGPNRMALEADAKLAVLLALRDAATDPKERKRLSGHIKLLRSMSRWSKTRSGYVKPPAKR